MMSSFASTIQMRQEGIYPYCFKTKKKITIVDSFFSIACNSKYFYVMLHIYRLYDVMVYIFQLSGAENRT